MYRPFEGQIPEDIQRLYRGQYPPWPQNQVPQPEWQHQWQNQRPVSQGLNYPNAYQEGLDHQAVHPNSQAYYTQQSVYAYGHPLVQTPPDSPYQGWYLQGGLHTPPDSEYPGWSRPGWQHQGTRHSGPNHLQSLKIPSHAVHKPPTLPDSPTFHLKTFLQTKSQLEIAGHFLGARLEDTAAAGLDQVALIGLDAEQWEFGEHDITELGISVLVPSTVDRSADTHNAIDLVRETKNYHVRVKENAHKINQHFVGGYPENFEFGTTVFLSKLETGEFLRDSFQQVDPGTGRPRPVILVGHAVHNDIEMMKAHFNIDLEREANIVGTLDSQVLAVGARYASFSRPISLANLLAKFDIKEDFLHNAGNDIACTMLATFVTALEGLRQSGKILEEEYEGVVAGMAEKYDELKKHSKQVSLPPYGDMSFCTRCDGTGHFHGTCTAANVFCYACRTDSHMAAKCLEADDEGAGIPVDKEQVPVPCEFCVMNNDPAVYTMAYYHWTKDCLRSKI